jgi:hypothetical protein
VTSYNRQPITVDKQILVDEEYTVTTQEQYYEEI